MRRIRIFALFFYGIFGCAFTAGPAIDEQQHQQTAPAECPPVGEWSTLGEGADVEELTELFEVSAMIHWLENDSVSALVSVLDPIAEEVVPLPANDVRVVIGIGDSEYEANYNSALLMYSVSINDLQASTNMQTVKLSVCSNTQSNECWNATMEFPGIDTVTVSSNNIVHWEPNGESDVTTTLWFTRQYPKQDFIAPPHVLNGDDTGSFAVGNTWPDYYSVSVSRTRNLTVSCGVAFFEVSTSVNSSPHFWGKICRNGVCLE